MFARHRLRRGTVGDAAADQHGLPAGDHRHRDAGHPRRHEAVGALLEISDGRCIERLKRGPVVVTAASAKQPCSQHERPRERSGAEGGS
jgi:hypothetical protein